MESIRGRVRALGLLAFASVAAISSCDGGFVDVTSMLSVELFESAAVLPGLQVEVTDAVGTRGFHVEDFEPGTAGRLTLPIEVAEHDSLTVAIRLEQDGTVIADASLTLALQPDFVWGVDVFRQVDDPLAGCFGCRGSVAADIAFGFDRTPGERLWLVWSGRPWNQDGIL